MIVVTGASGLLGSSLIRTLLKKGEPVRALVHNDQRGIEGLDVELIRADIRDPGALAKAFTGARLVFHLAGLISLRMDSWPALRAINVDGAHNVVQACLETGVQRLVHFSSIHAHQQEPLDQPVDESAPLADLPRCTPYDRSKAMGEKEICAGRNRGLDTVILNPTGVIGPHDHKPSFFGSAVLQLARGRIPVLVEGGFNWVDSRDVAEGAYAAAVRAPGGAKYILGGEWHSISEIAAMVCRHTGRREPMIKVSMDLAEAAAPLMLLLANFTGGEPIYTRATIRALHSNRQISSQRAAQELGYRSRPTNQSIQDLIVWFRENGSLP